MVKTYSHAESQLVLRKVEGLLRPSHPAIGIHVGITNAGHTLALVLADRFSGTSRLYEFGWAGRDGTSEGRTAPHVSNAALLAICDEWETGQAVPSPQTEALTAAGPLALEVTTRDGFLNWLRRAKPGDQCLYFRGELAQFRKDATARILELQIRADSARPSRARPAAESVELESLMQRLDLIAAVFKTRDAGLIAPTQRRAIEGDGMIYYAAKRRDE